MKTERNIWLDAVMGVAVGDALGCPVQFLSREEIASRKQGPVVGMEEYGTYDMPIGTWTDDTSLTLATLDSIRELKEIDLEDIATRFIDWYEDGEYTPYGQSFDIGNTCSIAIENYERSGDVYSCGRTSVHSNGNGSLMRIMPACLHVFEKDMDSQSAIKIISEVSGLTHNHLRSKMACGLYYFCVCSLVNGYGKFALKECLQKGLDDGFDFYGEDIANLTELAYFSRLRNLDEFEKLSSNEIKSTGYVLDSLEAAIWSLITTESFEDCLLKAVNLGDDTDTVAAIAGGLAGLYYGYENMPSEWLTVIKRRDWIEQMCLSINSNQVEK